ncbi:nucleobase-ascorbate transporter LPE1-like [Phoenix dactylifera]|uniref:Nucleobase-ascorbate transporter LPE1-like n=1 Tax=Phoenix dactylifera TaxID=42345 RepID=A0A8B7CZP8_PHODC|nr:nucleobase-ascorbate transporter LPE1-like [Phoenix dactylifera]
MAPPAKPPGPPAKLDEFVPHPVKEQLPGIDFCLASPPPWAEAIVLGFQHYLVMLGTTVLIPTILVPQMGGGAEEKARVIQTLLFVAGINTLLQAYFGTRLPAVIGGSFTYLLPTISIILSRRFVYIIDPYERFVQTMRAIQGALIAASSFQIIVGFLGIWRIVMRFLSPLAAVPFVTLAALGLFYIGFPNLARCVEVGLPALVLLIFFSQYVPHAIGRRRAIFDRFAVLITVALVWAYAYILTVAGAYKHRPPQTQFSCRADRSGLLRASKWIKVPYPFQWGGPTFDAGDVFAMMAASFASLIESTGTLIAVSRFASATPIPPAIFSRGIGWQGIGILLDGMFGTANGSAASVENAGLLGLTRVGSRRVIQIAACFMLFFSILGKFGAILASIPLPIVAALYCVLFAYAASAGLGFLQFCNLNSLRTKFILGFSLFMGLSVPEYFKEYEILAGYGPVHTRSRAFNDVVNVIFSSPATVAAIIAYFLDFTLLRGEASTRRDRGWHWWEKFRSYRTDPRSEEFYSLPYNLNKFFPSL